MLSAFIFAPVIKASDTAFLNEQKHIHSFSLTSAKIKENAIKYSRIG
jgi:hypothetical protein